MINDDLDAKIEQLKREKGIDVAEIVKQMVHEGFLDQRELA